MNVIHLQKAFAFIAKGLVEKEKLLKYKFINTIVTMQDTGMA